MHDEDVEPIGGFVGIDVKDCTLGVADMQQGIVDEADHHCAYNASGRGDGEASGATSVRRQTEPKMAAKYLRCFAHGSPDGPWEAICIDLDIAVEGASYYEVRERLEEAVRSYVADALNEDAETAARLLNRQAPFFVRVRYLLAGLAKFLSGNRDGDSWYPVFFPCPA